MRMTLLTERIIRSTLPFCGGRVRTRHPELCVVRQEEDAGGRVIKLTSVVTLDSFDSPAELSRHIGK
jgi:hypothetical protein